MKALIISTLLFISFNSFAKTLNSTETWVDVNEKTKDFLVLDDILQTYKLTGRLQAIYIEVDGKAHFTLELNHKVLGEVLNENRDSQVFGFVVNDDVNANNARLVVTSKDNSKFRILRTGVITENSALLESDLGDQLDPARIGKTNTERASVILVTNLVKKMKDRGLNGSIYAGSEVEILGCADFENLRYAKIRLLKHSFDPNWRKVGYNMLTPIGAVGYVFASDVLDQNNKPVCTETK